MQNSKPPFFFLEFPAQFKYRYSYKLIQFGVLSLQTLDLSGSNWIWIIVEDEANKSLKIVREQKKKKKRKQVL